MQFYDLELKQYFWRDKRLIDALLFVYFLWIVLCISSAFFLYTCIKKERQFFFCMEKERRSFCCMEKERRRLFCKEKKRQSFFYIEKERQRFLVQSLVIYSYDVFLFYFTWNETKEEEEKMNWIWEAWARWRVRVINKKYVPRARNEERKRRIQEKNIPGNTEYSLALSLFHS